MKFRLLVTTVVVALLSAVAPGQAHAVLPKYYGQLYLTVNAPIRLFNYNLPLSAKDLRYKWTGTSLVTNTSKTPATGVYVAAMHLSGHVGAPVGRALFNGKPRGPEGARTVYVGTIEPGRSVTVSWAFIAPASTQLRVTDFTAKIGGAVFDGGPSVGHEIYLQPYR